LLLACLSGVASFLEGLGVLLILPVLEFASMDSVDNVSDNMYWNFTIWFFEKMNIPINLILLIMFSFSMFLGRQIFIYLSEIYNTFLYERSHYKLRNLLFHEYICADYSIASRIGGGAVINTLATESDRIMGWFKSIFHFFQAGAMLISIIVLLVITNMQLTVISLGLLFVGSFATIIQLRKTVRISKEVTDNNNRWTTNIIEKINMLRLIKLSNTIDKEYYSMDYFTSKVRVSLYGLNKIRSVLRLIVEPINVAVIFIIIYISVESLHVPVLEVGGFLFLLTRLVTATKDVINNKQTFDAHFIAINNYNTLLNKLKQRMPPSLSISNGQTMNELVGAEGIKFSNVSFKYVNEIVTDRLTCSFQKNKTTALLGASGAGKSTIFDLLTKLYLPISGTIFIDGKDISSIDNSEYYKNIAVVSQDVKLINGTIIDNISYGINATKDEIYQAAMQAYCHDFILKLEGGYQYMVGVDGYGLSGGQKQRISLARALLRKPNILLLDEPTSSLDSTSERYIQQSIEKLRESEGITIIIIAHNLKTIRNADHIIVIDQGKVIEEGFHADLLLNDAWYKKQIDS
jgi:ATP-binding cassette, subfamily B, bacterial MsbA